ncbi:hypothetical protein HMPREF9004_1816 [Schaalia cardiffensis F0333]|uniref:Uncharacterized protein n=1 Tax=Schaalia cardiffensis F0333 TaxID=888050 RepID=N6W4I5_9ACTO|nr:hypothetical protein HMPREF9004_1816 [Schaalia cardiffensis F0333]
MLTSATRSSAFPEIPFTRMGIGEFGLISKKKAFVSAKDSYAA